MKPPETFETPRLVLRLPTVDDAEPVYRKYAQDPEVTKFLVWRPHESINATREYLHRCIHCWNDETAFSWIITNKGDNALLGMIEIRIEEYRADLGYVISRQYWGNGYATEAAKSIIKWALDQKSIYRVWELCDVKNIASARVMEKSGMQKEGILRRFILHPNISNEPRDCFCYSIVK